MSHGAKSGTNFLWLQLLLVAGLVTSAVTLAEVYRGARSDTQVSERALHDYGNFAAWSLREHLTSGIRDAINEALGPVNHGDGLHTSKRIPDAGSLGHYFPWSDRCACHRPEHGPLPLRFIGFALGADTVAIRMNQAGPELTGWLVDTPGTMDVMGRQSRTDPMRHGVLTARSSPEERRWLSDALSGIARRLPRSNWGYDIIVRPVAEGGTERVHLLATRSMPTERGDTIVYAVEYTAKAIDTLVTAILATRQILPASLLQGHEYRNGIDLEVADATGNRLFATRSGIAWRLAGAAQLPDTYGGLRILAQLRPDLAESLLIGGVPRSRIPLLLVILSVALGLTGLATVQLRREVRFAAERATFVANVSHDLRTPLAQVRLVIDTLRLGRAEDPTMRSAALQVADREVLRLQHLVEGVLRFTRGTRGDIPTVRVDVVAEARETAAEFAPLAEVRGTRVVVEAEEVASITLQQGAIRQILLNLLDNALKYGPEQATITVMVQPRAGGGVRLAVADQGLGVPRGDRERIWRPFERGSVSKTAPVSGSGIGLTIVQQIARYHKGKVWVEEAPGGGALFIVELPDE